MKVIFLGTNGWYDTKDGNTLSTFVETDDFNLIFDAGNGLSKLKDYVNFDKPAYLFISHIHIDHIEGLHTLPRLKQKLNLNIYCPEIYVGKLKSLLDSPFTMPLKNLTVNAKLCAFNEGEYKSPFDFTVRKLQHVDDSFGFRVKLDGKILTYCCDTSVGESDRQLSKDADLLIHECSLFEEPKSNGWGHSSFRETARMASEQGVKKLALTHFDPNIYLSIGRRKEAERLAKDIFPGTFMAKDDLKVNI